MQILQPDYLFHLAGESNTSDDFNQSKLVNVDFAKFLLDAIEINKMQKNHEKE